MPNKGSKASDIEAIQRRLNGIVRRAAETDLHTAVVLARIRFARQDQCGHPEQRLIWTIGIPPSHPLLGDLFEHLFRPGMINHLPDITEPIDLVPLFQRLTFESFANLLDALRSRLIERACRPELIDVTCGSGDPWTFGPP